MILKSIEAAHKQHAKTVINIRKVKERKRQKQGKIRLSLERERKKEGRKEGRKERRKERRKEGEWAEKQKKKGGKRKKKTRAEERTK